MSKTGHKISTSNVQDVQELGDRMANKASRKVNNSGVYTILDQCLDGDLENRRIKMLLVPPIKNFDEKKF